MKRKTILRHSTDLAMTILLLVLMAYSVTGQAVHEWMGIALFILFILHHLLNLQWLRSIAKGRYTAARILQSVLVVLLFLSMIAQVISGLAMSRYAMPFLNIPLSTSAARLVHLSCGYWSFLLASLHLGLHGGVFLAMGQNCGAENRSQPEGELSCVLWQGPQLFTEVYALSSRKLLTICS